MSIRSSRALLAALLTSLCAALSALPAAAFTVVVTPATKRDAPTIVSHAAGSTVTISVRFPGIPVGATPPAAPAVPTFTWDLYDKDGPFREGDDVDFDETWSSITGSGWLMTRTATPVGTVTYHVTYTYTFSGLPAWGELATDPIPGQGDPDAWVEVVATIAGQSETVNVCTPGLPGVGQADLGVRQPPGSADPKANVGPLFWDDIAAFSRGHDEIADLLDPQSGVEPGLFFSTDAYAGQSPLMPGEAGPLLVFTAPASELDCVDEVAGGVPADREIAFLNLNTGAPGSGAAAADYYFVRENSYTVEWSGEGDPTAGVPFYFLDDGSGRAVTALAVEDSGVRGVFEPGDYMIYAYEGAPELLVRSGPESLPSVLSANGLTFDGTATLGFEHIGPGLSITPTGSITSLTVASNASPFQPVPNDRVFTAYDDAPPPPSIDAFTNGGIGLFSSDVGQVFDFENASSALGGQREVHIDVTTPDGSGVYASTSGGVYLHDQAYDTLARSEVVWDGTDASPGLAGSGSLGLDLEADPANAFAIQIERLENHSGALDLPSIGAFVELDEPGRPRAEALFPFHGATVVDEGLVLPFHLFGPDLSQVAAVGMVVDGAAHGDFFGRIAHFGTTHVPGTFPPVVEGFDHAQASVFRTTVGPVFGWDRHPMTAMGEVEISADVLASENIASLSAYTGNGELTWSQGPLVYAAGAVTWDGMDGSEATQLTSALDLAGSDSLEITIESLAFHSGVTGGVDVGVSLVSRTNPAQTFLSPMISLTGDIAAPQKIVIPFDQLAPASLPFSDLPDLSEVASLSLDIDGATQANFDLVIGEVGIVPLPEPGAVSLLVSGAGLLLALGRRRTRR